MLIIDSFSWEPYLFIDCQGGKCKPVYVETCGSVTLPANIVPQHML